MKPTNDAQPLHEISTRWSDVVRAHREGAEGHSARERMVLRYIGAVRHDMARILRDEGAAEELAQEFAIRALRGDFRGADPKRGRFRDYVKVAASNLVRDHDRRRNARPISLSPEAPESAAPPIGVDEADAGFLRSWRRELFQRAMAALADYQRTTGRPFHDIIDLRTDGPRLTPPEMAARLSASLGKPVTDGWVRQNLLRARECLRSPPGRGGRLCGGSAPGGARAGMDRGGPAGRRPLGAASPRLPPLRGTRDAIAGPPGPVDGEIRTGSRDFRWDRAVPVASFDPRRWATSGVGCGEEL